MSEQTCDCPLCRLGRKIDAIEGKLLPDEVAALNDLWNRCECAETDLEVAQTQLAAIKKLCMGGLTEAMKIVGGDE